MPEEQQFRGIQVDNLIADDILEVAIDKRNILWIFMKSGNNLSFSINSNPDGSISLEPKKLFDEKNSSITAFMQARVLQIPLSVYSELQDP